jgi:ubiquinone/menaquinone biosynthesis C-methylase UbiE
MELEEYRRTSREVWEAMAPGWGKWAAEMETANAPVRAWLVRELDPRPGDTMLELSAGAGETGFEIARLLGDDGRLISSDFASEMVDVARRRGNEIGLRNVEYRVIDAERIELPDNSVDGVVCRYGYMLVADAARAFSETRRVLRPGGRLALAVWSSAEDNPWASIAGRLLVERGHLPPPEPGAPGIFALADEDRLRTLLGDAGFTSMRVEQVPVTFRFPSVDDYVAWATTTAGALAMVLRGFDESQRAAFGADLDELFAPFAAEGGHRFPGVALCAAAS